MTDRELLELAAKAEGTVYQETSIQCFKDGGPVFLRPRDGLNFQWDPLIDDGDAFQLAVKLRINIYNPPGKNASASFLLQGDRELVIYMNEKSADEAAVRRAIVRAAAELGESK